MSKLIVNEIEKYDASQLTISSPLTVSGGITGTLSTAAQTNITSVGTLSSLAVLGNATFDTTTLVVDAANNRVGVGIASPSHKLDIFDSSPSIATRTTIKVRDNAQSASDVTAETKAINFYGATNSEVGYLSFNHNQGFGARGSVNLFAVGSERNIRFGTNGSERMRITSSGNVGIGGSPTTKLDVVGTYRMQFRTDDAIPELRAVTANGASFKELGLNGSQLVFNTSSTERMRIHSGGDVSFRDSSANEAFYWDASAASLGIGTNSPKERFELLGLNGNIRLYGRNGIGDNQISSNVYFSGSWVRDNASYGATAIRMNEDGFLAFHTTSATSGYPDERMRILSSGGLTFNGDTSSANALDDYEEGTWTVAISTNTGSVTMNTDFDTASYVKIGGLVTVGGYVEISSVSSPTGYIQISLPYTPVETPELSGLFPASVVVNGSVSKNVNDFASVISVGGLRIYIADVAALSSGAANAQQLKAGTVIYFSLTYKTF